MTKSTPPTLATYAEIKQTHAHDEATHFLTAMGTRGRRATEPATVEFIKAHEQRAALLQMVERLAEALTGILEIGKRDLSNPKYAGYWEDAFNVLASLPTAARAYSEERGRLVARVKELEGTAATEYAARGSHPETALEKELGDEFARIAMQGPTEGMISRSAYAAVELVKKHIGVRTPGTVEVCEMCETTGPSKCTGDLTCTLKDCPILAAAAESGEK